MSNPPPEGEFWRAFAAVTILPISGTDKTILGCLVDFANSKTGACWPGQGTIANATGIDLRAVKRSIQNLIETPYLKRTRRRRTSNLYEVGWDALLQAFDAYKERRSNKDRDAQTVTDRDARVTDERGVREVTKTSLQG